MQDFDVKADDMENMDNMHNRENPDQNIERDTEQNSEQTGIKGDDSDFKYCMQDTEKVYIGARYSYAELMESLNADLTNKMIVEKANPAEEKHYLALLEKSYATYLDTFQKLLSVLVNAIKLP